MCLEPFRGPYYHYIFELVASFERVSLYITLMNSILAEERTVGINYGNINRLFAF